MTISQIYVRLKDKMPFDDLLGSGYLELMQRRLYGETEELAWPRQARDLLRPFLHKGTTILEVGCCLGTAYRAFETTGVKYIGLDNELKYLAIGKEWYESDSNIEFIEHDIIRATPSVKGDIVLCSAMLEHCPGFQPALKHIVEATRQFLFLRTFLGPQEEIAYNFGLNKQYLYTNQYAFQDVLGYLAGMGFVVNIYRDRYTDSIPQLQNGLVRTFYIVLAEKR